MQYDSHSDLVGPTLIAACSLFSLLYVRYRKFCKECETTTTFNKVANNPRPFLQTKIRPDRNSRIRAAVEVKGVSKYFNNIKKIR